MITEKAFVAALAILFAIGAHIDCDAVPGFWVEERFPLGIHEHNSEKVLSIAQYKWNEIGIVLSTERRIAVVMPSHGKNPGFNLIGDIGVESDLGGTNPTKRH